MVEHLGKLARQVVPAVEVDGGVLLLVVRELLGKVKRAVLLVMETTAAVVPVVVRQQSVKQVGALVVTAVMEVLDSL
jgi:hypothetical protein